MFRGVLTIVAGNNTHHKMTGKYRRSVKAGQVHRDQLWGGAEGHARTVVYQVVDSVRGFAAADVRGSVVVSGVKNARQSEFTENTTIRCRRKRLIGARVETHPAIPTIRSEHRIVLLGTVYIHTVSDAEGASSW